jgi:hypothetical protein
VRLPQITASKKVSLSGGLNWRDVGFADEQLIGTEKQTLSCGGLLNEVDMGKRTHKS